MRCHSRLRLLSGLCKRKTHRSDSFLVPYISCSMWPESDSSKTYVRPRLNKIKFWLPPSLEKSRRIYHPTILWFYCAICGNSSSFINYLFSKIFEYFYKFWCRCFTFQKFDNFILISKFSPCMIKYTYTLYHIWSLNLPLLDCHAILVFRHVTNSRHALDVRTLYTEIAHPCQRLLFVPEVADVLLRVL